MFQNILELTLFTVPGLASELHYLMLIEEKFSEHKMLSIVRGLCFSIIILFFRCLYLISKGNGNLELSNLFLNIENTFHYIILSAILIFLLPNAHLLIHNIYAKIISKIN